MILLKPITALIFLTLLIACSSADSEDSTAPNCSLKTVKQLQLQQLPKQVLIVPLLNDGPWPQRPANDIAHFYRRQFNAKIMTLKNIRGWQDYYRQTQALKGQSAQFDRVIFIGHGGFDGPVLNEEVYWQNLSIKDNEGELLQFSEAQPGLKNTLLIRYQVDNNLAFSEYIASHAADFTQLPENEIRSLLKDFERRLQPLDNKCFNRYCGTKILADTAINIKKQRIKLCERICRPPLYQLRSSVEISPARFYLFADSLTSLTAKSGLIFFGTCNPGSKAPEKMPLWAETELFINTNLAGGPYENYVHLISTATGRASAGPIGHSSADDVVKRIKSFENNQQQRYLCVVEPRNSKRSNP